MQIIFSLVPIFLFFAILLFVFYYASKMFSKRSKLWTVKKLWIFLLLYMGLGFASILILLITSKDSNMTIEMEQVKEIIEEENDIWHLLDQNRIDEIHNEFIVREWTYHLPSDELVITRKDDVWSTSVYIGKREDPNSNEIYAKVIQTPYTVNGIDLKDKVSGNQFIFLDNELLIKEGKEGRFVYNQLDPTIHLIKEFGDGDNKRYGSYRTGLDILYLNVPEHINIIDEDESYRLINS